MKNFLLKTWLTMICLLFGVGTMWGAVETGTYVLCTSTSDLVAGTHYIIASGTSGSVNVISNVEYTNNRKIVSATVTDSKIEVSNNSTIMTLTLGGSTGAWTFYTDNYAGTDGYLASAASGSNNYCRVISTSTTSTISFSDNAAVITLQPHTSRNILRFNSTSSCFACYSSGQGAVYLYKKENSGGTAPEPTTTYNVIIANNIANGTVTASTTSAAAGATVTLTASPATGYEFGSWNVTNASNSESITVTDNKFAMPAADVNVSATFNAKAGHPENEIFYESFDTNDGTGGNDNQWSGSIATNNIKQDNEGWVFENGAGADKCAKFGAGSKLGTATTPALGQACNATLTFKAGAWDGKSESTTLKLSVIGGGSVSPETVTMTKGAWTDFEVTLTNLTADSKIKFEGNAASNSRFFLDEVSIVKTGDATPEEPQKTLSSIEVKYHSNKYKYTEGEFFKPAGLEITATYDDESKEDITYVDHESAFTFSPALDEPLTTSNTTITITYGGKTTTQAITVEPVVNIGNTQETAYTVAQAIDLIDAGKGLSTPVYVKGIVSKIVSAYSESYGNISFDVSADGETTGQQFQFFRNFKGAEKQKWTSEAEAPAVGDQVIGYGTLTKYNTTYEFAEGNYIVSIVKSTTSKTKPELSFENASYNATIGEAFTAPTLINPNGVTVSYTSSENGVATVDNTGAVTLVGAGTTTITATFDGTDDATYESNSAKYTLVVKAATTPEPEDATPGTYDIAVNNALWGTSETGTYNGTIPETLTGTQNGVTITFNKGEGANLYINDTETRIYAKEELVVSVPNGYSIIKIEGEKGDKTASTVTTAPEGYNATNYTWEGNSQTVSYAVDKAHSFVTLTVTFVKGETTPDTPDTPSESNTLTLVAQDSKGDYYATFSANKDVIFLANSLVEVKTVFTDGDEVVLGSLNDESWAMVEGVESTDSYGYYVPANTGVLICSGEATVNYYNVTDYEYNQNASDFSDNMLRPASAPMTGDCKFYKLAYNNYTSKTGLGFYWGAENGAAFNAKAGGAYLAVPSEYVQSNMRGFSFDFEGTPTGIESISNDVVAGEIYNLQGQRINRLQQGVNIVNGRKVIR